MEKATFAAGCFWGVEETFRNVEGVVGTTVGYTGGHTENPSYEDVCSGTTGHAEAVQVEFDPNIVSYERLLEIFWECHDPTTLNRQGLDIGSQYRSAVFYHNSDQQLKAEEIKQKLDGSGLLKRPVVTVIDCVETFYPAEEYHQQYFKKRGMKSCHINRKLFD